MKLVNGDCLVELQQIPENFVDFAFLDLPYGVTSCRWDCLLDMNQLAQNLLPRIRENGVLVFTAQQPFTALVMNQFMPLFWHSLVWDKCAVTGHLNAKKQPLRRHEDILVFRKGSGHYSPIMRTGKKRTKGGRKDIEGQVYGNCPQTEGVVSDQYYPTSILEVSNAQRVGRTHPTEKPVELLDWLIRTYCPEGGLVLDPTMGSGASGVAAKSLGRDYWGCELDARFYQVAQSRVGLV